MKPLLFLLTLTFGSLNAAEQVPPELYAEDPTDGEIADITISIIPRHSPYTYRPYGRYYRDRDPFYYIDDPYYYYRPGYYPYYDNYYYCDDDDDYRCRRRHRDHDDD